MKKILKEKILKVFIKIHKILFFYIPNTIIFSGLFLIALNAYFFFFNNMSLNINIEILISSIIITATLSAIGFTYSASLDKRKKIYKDILYCSERFLHSTLLIIMALIIFWVVNHFYVPFNEYDWFIYIKWFFYLLVVLSFGFLVDAARYLSKGIEVLDRVLVKKERDSGNRAEFFNYGN